MIAVDTNVLVRLLANDDRVQSPRAAELFSSEDVYISKTVLLETEWVLRFSYGFAREAIWAAFDKMLSAASVTIEDVVAVRAAVDGHAAGMDLADGLHLFSGEGIDKFVTFDRKLVRQARRARVAKPIQVL
jgi:predicted nucleic-acid-binding protein